MDLIDVTIPPARIPSGLQKRKLSRSSQSLLKKVEHHPSVNSQKLRRQKYILWFLLFLANASIVYVSMVRWHSWISSSILIFRPLVNCLEITLAIFGYIIRRLRKQTLKVPETPESLVYLLPCYNESYEELTKSLSSLAEQNSLNSHKKALIVVCDGRIKGSGMLKTTAAFLTEDIVESASSTIISKAYMSWDGGLMDVEIVQGQFKGLPICCIIKEENRGKRDGIVLIRSFLYKFNKGDLSTSLGDFTARFSAKLTDFLHNASIRSVDYIVGIDADTRFDTDCVFNLIQTVRENEKIVGVTGYILPDPAGSKSFWIPYLYQNAEYKLGQYRRRLRQDVTTEKVTCLPGCCQLLRVEDRTCGTEIMEQFKYYPKEQDGLFRVVRSIMSEDRDHVCLVLRDNADAYTRQCLAARAYTSVPQSLSVYLSQRRRWTIGPMVSDMLLTLRQSTGWVERLAAVATILNTFLYPSLVVARAYWERSKTGALGKLYFLDIYRITWDLSIALYSRSFSEAIQYLIGWYLCLKMQPNLTCIVLLYSLYYLDDLRWGKTRQVSATN